MKKILRVPYFIQETESDCGPSCIKMIISYLKGRSLSENECKKILRFAMNSNPEYPFGTSKTRMKGVIHKLNYQYRSVYGFEGIKWALKRDLPIIVLCFWRDKSGEYEHYAVVTGIENGYIHVNDPYFGRPRRLRKSYFMSHRGNLYWKPRVKWGFVVSKEF